jgi:hypothetical protein
VLDSEDADESELLLDELEDEDVDDCELLLDVPDEEGSGPVGLALLQAASAPTPARAAPPDSRIRNSRLSERRSPSVGRPRPSFFSSMVISSSKP